MLQKHRGMHEAHRRKHSVGRGGEVTVWYIIQIGIEVGTVLYIDRKIDN